MRGQRGQRRRRENVRNKHWHTTREAEVGQGNTPLSTVVGREGRLSLSFQAGLQASSKSIGLGSWLGARDIHVRTRSHFPRGGEERLLCLGGRTREDVVNGDECGEGALFRILSSFFQGLKFRVRGRARKEINRSNSSSIFIWPLISESALPF